MTWAVVSPSGFGDFFLEGDFVGWKEQIQDVFDKMPEIERALYGNRSILLAYAASEKFTHDHGSLNAFEKPRVFKATSLPKSIAAVIELRDRLLVVSEPLKNLIEELQPDTNDFWPIELELPKGKATDDRYFGMVISTFLDSFDTEGSDPQMWSDQDGKPTVLDRKKACFARIALSPEITSQVHVWREKRLRGASFFISDELKDKIDQAGLRFPTHYKLRG